MAAKKNPPKIYQLKITLDDIKPFIWRRFQIRGDASLILLHECLQGLMGWQNYHLYFFEIAGVEYADPALIDDELEMEDAWEIKAQDAFPKVRSKIRYVYDFGDNWHHTLVIEKVLDPEIGVRYPVCIDGERACPPEDCGGVSGYYELLSILKNPKHEDYQQMRTSAGRFDPERFSCDIINRKLSRRVVVKEPRDAQR